MGVILNSLTLVCSKARSAEKAAMAALTDAIAVYVSGQRGAAVRMALYDLVVEIASEWSGCAALCSVLDLVAAGVNNGRIDPDAAELLLAAAIAGELKRCERQRERIKRAYDTVRALGVPGDYGPSVH